MVYEHQFKHKTANRTEFCGTNKKITRKKQCNRKIYIFIIAVQISSSHLKVIEWNWVRCHMGTRNVYLRFFLTNNQWSGVFQSVKDIFKMRYDRYPIKTCKWLTEINWKLVFITRKKNQETVNEVTRSVTKLYIY